MATSVSTSSIQEAAVQFANQILGGLNSAVSNMVGVDVIWFRLQPDKRSQDVIFQSYTLYGVEDCPLSFKAVYSDNSYDDAAITYNIMGINFNVPMTLDIALDVWKAATNDDGTIPQKGDIVFIPMSRKLMEVVSMQPVKQLGAQLTSYKVNLSIYTPTRSRIVGEQLKESIEDNTTNLRERFGEDIKTNVKDLVDDNQLSLYTSTSKDKQKEISPVIPEGSSVYSIKNIISEDIYADGHTVARSYYTLDVTTDKVIKYNISDSFTNEDERCLSCWIKIKEPINSYVKNIKNGFDIEKEDGNYYAITQTGGKFKIGNNVVIKRGNIIIPGEVVDKDKILVNGDLITKLSKQYKNWNHLPGFALLPDNVTNILGSDIFEVNIKGGGAMISIKYEDDETLIQLSENIKFDKWYGLIINMSDKFDVYSFTDIDGKLSLVSSVDGIENEIYENVNIEEYYIKPSVTNLTNIRLYNKINNDIDKQLSDLVSYNVKNDSFAIINDSADVYLNAEYKGRQR